jgi:hypothetical protein
MPCPPKADSANAVVGRSAELPIACVANHSRPVNSPGIANQSAPEPPSENESDPASVW